MSIENDSLPVPESAFSNSDSKEVIRAWVASNGLHCSLRVGQWEPQIWGMVFSDILRHVVASEVEENGTNPKVVVRTIMDKLMDEVNAFGEELGFEETNK